MLKEFRDFALRGNVVDLAKRVIIGAVRGMRVSSLDDGVSLPATDDLRSRTNFSNLFIVVSQPEQRPSLSFTKVRDLETEVSAYGLFTNAVVKFTIVASGCTAS